MCITVIYIHACVGIKHYDKFFKYPNSLFIKVVRIPIRLLESYDFTTLRKHVNPNPTMNPNLVESMLGHNPNHRILYKTIQSRLCYGLHPILLTYQSHLFSCSKIVCHHPKPFSYGPLFPSQVQTLSRRHLWSSS